MKKLKNRTLTHTVITQPVTKKGKRSLPEKQTWDRSQRAARSRAQCCSHSPAKTKQTLRICLKNVNEEKKVTHLEESLWLE